MSPPNTIIALRKILDTREATIRNLRQRLAVDARYKALRAECTLLIRSNEERLALIQEMNEAGQQIRRQVETKEAAQVSALNDLKIKDVEIGRIQALLHESRRLAANLRHQVEAKEQSQVSALTDLKTKDAEIGRLDDAVKQLCRQTNEKEIALCESQKLAGALARQLGDREKAVRQFLADMTAKEKILQELKRICAEREALIKRLSATP